jgi:hypothetical protein
MKLPENAIGPTDIASYRDCPRRFEFGMRRHDPELGEHPEAQGPNTAYGSAVHEMIAWVETHDWDDEDAIQRAFDLYSKWLEPDDLALLREDLATYHEREPLGVRTVAVEREIRVPLFDYDGETIYFRTRIDRLYQRLDNPAVFIHVDYKSSKHRKTPEEVHSDTQLWATNWAVHEHWPECERLEQLYDQLRYGIEPTSKNAAQRAQIKDWLVKQVTTILRDTELEPKKNQWCPWCPLMESCPVVAQSTDFALAQIAALAPAEKQGRKTVLNLDLERFEVYAEQLDEVGHAMKVLKRFDESVKGVIRRMPAQRRAELGYAVMERNEDVFPPEAMSAVRAVVGEEAFDRAVKLTKAGLEKAVTDEEVRERALGMAERRPGAVVVQKIKS